MNKILQLPIVRMLVTVLFISTIAIGLQASILVAAVYALTGPLEDGNWPAYDVVFRK